MKLFTVLTYVFLMAVGSSCRPAIVEVVNENPTPSELASSLEAANKEVGNEPVTKEPNPNLIGIGSYKYQIEAKIDGNYEHQCHGLSNGEVMKSLDVNFTETTNCRGGILDWVVNLNDYFPEIAQTSPFTIDSKLEPFILNLSSVSSKKVGDVETLRAIHVDYGEFELVRQPCPAGFCNRFDKISSMVHYWEIRKTPKSKDSLRTGKFAAAQTIKSGTAVLLRAVFEGTFQLPGEEFSVPLRISLELNDLNELERK